MKVYSVKPGSQEIRCSDGRMLLTDGPIGWGDSNNESANLCRAILADVFDKTIALQMMQRVKWRTVVKWQSDKPHAITEDEIKLVVADINRAAADAGPMIERMKRERPVFANDRAGPDQGWSATTPEIKRKESQDGKNSTNGGT